MRLATLFPLTISAFLLAACQVGPDYQRPEAPDVAAFANIPSGWSAGNPEAERVAKGPWWEVFNDYQLDSLEEQLLVSNPQLEAAQARLEQARARTSAVKSNFMPELNFMPGANRGKTTTNTTTGFGGGVTSNSFSLPFDLSWEIDLWGRIRSGIDSFEATEQSLEALHHNLMLTLQSELAVNWFSLRAIEAEKTVLRRTLELRDENLELLNNRLEAGVATELDVVRVEAERSTAAADLASLDVQETQLKAAIATLIGTPASVFQLSAPDLISSPPKVPAGIPSHMLERRPDVAAAERSLAAANADIGLATAALFPTISLTADGGYRSNQFDNLLSPSSRFWDVGMNMFAPILRRKNKLTAVVDESEALFQENFAKYRQQVLVSFQEVEASLGAIDALQRQSTALDAAVDSSQRGTDLSTSRYREGLSNYLEVIDAERTQLQVERQQVQVLGQRYTATIQLIKALGGGWN